ncbi:MAG: SDR family oxidoreductase [Chloroflexota bacterium]|jgi:3-oxoacyl-[acyl-carrier protein] reductase|nr:SDR family oxidoreductase [Chloroflexota bacterium]
MDLGLKGKIALLTGASSGLGFATAKALAKEGARIVINARNPDKLSTAGDKLSKYGDVVSLPGDITEPDRAEKLIGATIAVLGGLDLLFTNSGGPPPMPFEEVDDEAWQKAIDLVFMSHVRLIRSALPALRRSDSPAVLTVTSLSVKQPITNLVLSNSVRSATIGLTKTLALELASDKIRFNSILPSWTKTDRVYELLQDRAERNGTSLEVELEKRNKQFPLGRMCTPEEFANAATFLLSPAASYITGVMLTVDGGTYKGTF